MDTVVKNPPSDTLPPLIERLLKNAPDNGSGHGKASVVPPGVAGWGWGPFFWSWIWAIPNRVSVGFLALIPYIGIFIMLVLGKNGRVWAWQNRQWKSVEEFNKSQKIWSATGAVFFVIMVLISIWVFKTVGSLYNSAALGI